MHHQPPVHRSIDPAAAVVPEVRPRLRWRDVPVDGRTVPYGIAGSGTPVLFLHGFGLAPRTYAAAVERLAAVGVRVYAPALPGFGGTGALPHREHGFAGYGHWVARFLDAVGIDEPVPVVGHSFGGGVALASAHARVDRVSQLVLVN
ncbi:alpha/beta fold hydrolase, partial [Rhodococcus hoagii]|nr:alpha/beta fold hydrolase [Prescottella equi]